MDLRTLIPLDEAAVLNAVAQTGRLIVCHEACLTGGFGGEVVARVAEHCFDALRAPPLRVAAPDIPVPGSIPLEKVYLRPQARLLDAIRRSVQATGRSMPA